MQDWMDELLADLPAEPMPQGLILRLQARLRRARRRELWVRRAGRLALAWAAGLGAVGLWSNLENLAGILPVPTLAAALDWLLQALASPLDVLMAMPASLVAWAGSQGTALTLAFALLAVSAFFGLASLLEDQTEQSEVVT